MPNGSARLLAEEIKSLITDKITILPIEIKHNIVIKPAQPLGRGKCAGMTLVKMLISFFALSGQSEELVTYELDLRELPRNYTYQNDPETRDFKMNSLYYHIVDSRVIDITGVILIQ